MHLERSQFLNSSSNDGPVRDKAEILVEGNWGRNILLLINGSKLNGRNVRPLFVGLHVMNPLVSSNVPLEVTFCEGNSI